MSHATGFIPVVPAFVRYGGAQARESLRQAGGGKFSQSGDVQLASRELVGRRSKRA